jgi:ribonuclease VapC
MVIDSSALLAILNDEPERHAFNEAIQAADSRVMSAATFVEISIVIEARFGAQGLYDLDLFVERAGIEVVVVDREQAYVARKAFSLFGKGASQDGCPRPLHLKLARPR